MLITHTLRTIFLVAILVASNSPVAANTFESKLVAAAYERTKQTIRYDGSYHAIPYPNGDVPANTGVCTDVIIRSYRKLDIDLQKKVHEDISNNFEQYPSKRIWGLKKPDKNIDHRRVPNLRTFFSRNGESLKISTLAQDYQPGDLVTWKLGGRLPHIGIVSDKKTQDGRPMIVHNIGSGPKLEDVLFAYPITGHYRYKPLVTPNATYR